MRDGIRNRVPLLRDNPGLIYLDNAATTQKPTEVIEAVNDFYRSSNSNIRRGIYGLAVKADALLERARLSLSKLIGCEPEELVFTKNSTEAANLLAYGIGESRLRAGDNLIVSELEHHANYLPWQETARRHGAELRVWPYDPLAGQLARGWLEKNLNAQTRVIALTEMSNVLGISPDLPAVLEQARKSGVLVVADASQSAAHRPLLWKDSGYDAAFCTGHKIYGPMGVGLLYLNSELAAEIPPLLTGGGMIDDLPDRWLPSPYKFEAGTPDVAAISGLEAASRFLAEFSSEQIAAHELQLAASMREMLASKPRIRILGDEKTTADSTIISFVTDGIHPHDLAEVLAGENICVRAGHHCAKPLMRRLGIAAATRISLGMYNQAEEIPKVEMALEKALKLFK